MSEILGIVGILMVWVGIMVSHINITITYKEPEAKEAPVVNVTEAPVDPGYDEKGDPKEEDNSNSIDELLKVVNGIMLDEEDADEHR